MKKLGQASLANAFGYSSKKETIKNTNTQKNFSYISKYMLAFATPLRTIYAMIKNVIPYLIPFILAIFTFIGMIGPLTVINKPKPKLPTILLYNHIDVDTSQYTTFKERYYHVSTKQFEDHLRILKNRGLKILTRDEFNNALKTPHTMPDNAVLLVFSNGFSTIPQNALPLLKQYQAPALVFYNPAFIGREGFMVPDQVSQLTENNIAVTEPNTALLMNPEARYEVSGVIERPQFEDLLPNPLHNSPRWAFFVSLLVFFLVYVSFRAPRYALLLPVLMLPTYLFRFTVFGIPVTLLEAVLLATILGTYVMHGKELLRTLRVWPYLAPTIVFLVAGILATAAAQNKIQAVGGLKVLIIEPILFAVAVNYWYQTQNTLKRLFFFALTVSATVIAAVALANYFQNGAYVNFDLTRLTTYFGNPNYLASFLLAGLTATLYLILYTTAKIRFAVACAFLLQAIAFYFTRSDTATLALLVSVIFLVFTKYHKKLPHTRIILPVFVILALVISFFMFVLISSPFFTPWLEAGKLQTLLSRAYIYQTAFKIIHAFPLFGVGPLNFHEAYTTFVSLDSPEKNVALAHNTLLDFWTQFGILGLLAYLWLLIRLVRICVSSRIKPSIAFGTSAIVLALTLHGMFDSQYHKNDYAVIFWLMIALATFSDSSSTPYEVSSSPTPPKKGTSKSLETKDKK